MLLTLTEDRFITLCSAIASAVEKSAGSLFGIEQLTVVTDINTLEQCYIRSEVTAGLFNSEGGINYYREAGQYCYWIRKLKPFTGLHDSEDSVSIGNRLSEYIAYFVAAEVIRMSHEWALEALKSADRIEFHNENVELNELNNSASERLEPRIIGSLRYHVHSSGSLPALLESVYRLPLDEEFAYPQPA